MSHFIDPRVSVFDDEFTLKPYGHQRDLYPREDILGFHSESIYFLFRFEQARSVMFNRSCIRAGAEKCMTAKEGQNNRCGLATHTGVDGDKTKE